MIVFINYNVVFCCDVYAINEFDLVIHTVLI